MAKGTSTTPYVSAHAVIRFIQRALRVEVDADLSAFPALFAMQLHLYAASTSLEEVEAAILSPATAAAIRAGATRFRTEIGEIVVKNHSVVTILDPGPASWRRNQRRRPARAFRRDSIDADIPPHKAREWCL